MQNIYNERQDNEYKMSKHIKIDELSAYLDGEASASRALESHLDSCDACRERLASMRSVSRCLQDLPAPDVHPAFAQRVLAGISEQESAPRRFAIRRWLYGLTPVAIAAVLFLTVTLDPSVDRPAATVVERDSDGTAAMASILQQDEEVLFDQLSAYFARDDAIDSIVSAAYKVSTPEPVIPGSTLLAFALGDSKNRVHVNQQWPDSKDVRTTINHLNAQEANFFRQMLVVHAQEALLGEASFEG